MTVNPSEKEPVVITVAPNGARKTRKDHPKLPITPEQLAEEAFSCQQAGAAMIHLHVREEDDTHSLDTGRYRDAMAAIEDRCGENLLVQVTTEAVGRYTAKQQMAVVRELKPQSASLAIREIIPEDGEAEAKDFLHGIVRDGTLPHYILYDDKDLLRFQRLMEKDVIPEKNAFLLFVLGRYSEGQVSSPMDLLPFLNAMKSGFSWSVCAFGPLEHAAACAAVAMGGHVRVGFENNMYLSNGELAGGNSDLVAQIASAAESIGRPLAKARDIATVIGK
ncbi:MAG: 3-keto-5-aminohexanoate cleavage protein [Sneathiellales bacterium]|nr:3-keto-5-aminohexanoate cleavage protein [Sneathiellales bacterium]